LRWAGLASWRDVAAVADVLGGDPNPACIHEYTVFSLVFSHGSNTRIIRVNTYSEYTT
jgi:hypothetical protein